MVRDRQLICCKYSYIYNCLSLSSVLVFFFLYELNMFFFYPNRTDVILSAVPVATEKKRPHIEAWLLNLLGRSQRKGMTIYFQCDQITSTNEKRLDSYYGFETQREMFSSAGMFLVQKCCCFFFVFFYYPIALIPYLSLKMLIWCLLNVKVS